MLFSHLDIWTRPSVMMSPSKVSALDLDLDLETSKSTFNHVAEELSARPSQRPCTLDLWMSLVSKSSRSKKEPYAAVATKQLLCSVIKSVTVVGVVLNIFFGDFFFWWIATQTTNEKPKHIFKQSFLYCQNKFLTFMFNFVFITNF